MTLRHPVEETVPEEGPLFYENPLYSTKRALILQKAPYIL